MELGGSEPVPNAVPVIWGSVPQRNKNFTGREELLANLRERLLRTDSTALLPHAMHGMGGVGKTQLAVEYAYRFARHYQVVWWIPADQPGLIRSTLAGLAPRLDVTGVALGRVEDAVAAVLDALRQGKPKDNWLLIFDNADEPESIRLFMPVGPGHVIVTSRNRRWDEVADAIEVNVFNREESQQFFARRATGISDTEADWLSDALGDLPLALDQAASLLAQSAMTAEVYLDLLEKQTSRVLAERPSTTDYPLPVAATWSLSETKLREQTPNAMELLKRCAFFGSAPIPLYLLEQGRNVLGSPMKETFGDPILLSRSFRALGRYALARIDNYTRTLQVHRIIQKLIRDQLAEDEQVSLRHEVHQLMSAANRGDPDAEENWGTYEDLLQHAEPAQLVTCDAKESRQLVQDIVRYLYITGNYTVALERAEDALQHWTEKFGEDDQFVLVMNRLKAQALRGLARYKESYDLTTRLMERMQAVLGADHEELLIVMNGHCVDLRARGEFKESLEFTRRTLQRHQEVFGLEHPRTFAALNNLAVDLELKGEYAAARELHQRNYEEKRIFYARDDSCSVLYSQNALARSIREQGRYFDALKMAEQARAGYQELIQARVLSEAHHWVLSQAVDLAIARRAVGKIEQGGELAQETYDQYVQAYGPDHAATLAAAVCFGNALRESGNLEQAEILLDDTWRKYGSALGLSHPYPLACAVALAVSRRHQERLDSARELLEVAREGFTNHFGANHHCTLAATADLASALADLGDVADAAELEKDALPRFQAALGREHPATLACAANLAIDLKTLKEVWAGADGSGVVGQLRTVLGTGHPDVTAASEGHRLDIGLNPIATF
jgi:tetratricopeptide (TPR) repeat protein